jgi:hypothetical protein
MKKILINLALFQFGWLVCVLGGNVYAVVFTALALVIHQLFILSDPDEWKLIGLVVVIGCLWDWLMVQTGVIDYGVTLLAGIPLWLVCLWLLFATTFMHCLFWLTRYLWLAALFAALMGPASYWFGSSLTDAELAAPLTTSLAIMAVGWALLFPCGIYYAGRLKS